MLIKAPSCASTIGFGRAGEFEFTQGGLGFGQTYWFAVDAYNGTSWRGWSDPFNATTSAHTATTAVAAVAGNDPCAASGLTIEITDAVPSGTISKNLPRAAASSTCVWRIVCDTESNAVCEEGAQVYFHFEPYAELPTSTSALTVGADFFIPIAASDISLNLEVGLTDVVVVSPGTGCGVRRMGSEPAHLRPHTRVSRRQAAAAAA